MSWLWIGSGPLISVNLLDILGGLKLDGYWGTLSMYINLGFSGSSMSIR